ncbi:hypothetical protein EVAR_10416_1 [Eumeta japonica]|uniref:Uncharacterized protein n=1 Tax=Eumeta variegata TaxID=151549 RepID=A0A4C1UCV2_EUMVA|nr:hypothetical protein EVAR_10416_1 [Eumeta japonica]
MCAITVSKNCTPYRKLHYHQPNRKSKLLTRPAEIEIDNETKVGFGCEIKSYIKSVTGIGTSSAEIRIKSDRERNQTTNLNRFEIRSRTAIGIESKTNRHREQDRDQ